jgi:DNA-binding transcriptional LysR family regulator
MRGWNLDQLNSLSNVVLLGSFSAAARRLGVTQPAVSLQVRLLERQLGVKLLERTGRRVTATSAGLELLGHIQRIQQAVEAATDAMAAQRVSVTGRVCIGTGATACTYLLPPLLADLRRRYPGLELVVRTGNTVDILKGIEENAIDAGLVTLPAPGRMFAVTPLVKDEFVALFSSAHPMAHERVSAKMLHTLPLVLYEPAARTRGLVDKWFEAAGLHARPVMELGNVEAVKEIVAAGLGCGVLPRMAFGGHGARGDLTLKSLRPALYRELAIVTRQDKPVSRALRPVLDGLMALAAPPA